MIFISIVNQNTTHDYVAFLLSVFDTSFPYLQPLVPWLGGRHWGRQHRGWDESQSRGRDGLGTENNDIHSKWQADIRAQTGGSLTLFISPRTWIMAALRRESSNPSEVSPDIHHNITASDICVTMLTAPSGGDSDNDNISVWVPKTWKRIGRTWCRTSLSVSKSEMVFLS